MKKTTLLLSALLAFILFAFVGFILAVRADSLARLPVASRAALQDRQNNLVLLHIDDLNSRHPVVRSTWVALRLRSENQTALTFVRLYPNADDPRRGEKLASAFGLTNNGDPAPLFLRRLEEEGIGFSGYLLVDDSGMEQISGWVRQSDPKANLSGDAQLLQSGCLVITSAGDSGLPPFNWSAFSPHMNTDLAFDEIMSEWNHLTAAESPLRCELATP